METIKKQIEYHKTILTQLIDELNNTNDYH